MSRTRRLLPLLPLLALAALVALLAWPAFAQSDPTRPNNLTAEIVDDAVALSWNAPSEDGDSVDGYQVIRRKPGEDAKGVFHVIEDDTGDTQTSYTDTTATEAGAAYTYRVKARRGNALSGWSNYVRVDLPEEEQPTPTPTPTPAPETDPVDLAPSNLATGVVDNGVSLTWDAPSEDADTVTGYQVLRRDLGDQEQDKVTPLADTGGAGTAYVDTTVQAGDRYIYRVKAYRGTETSRWSNQANVTLPDDYGSDGTSSDEPEPTPTPTPTPEPERQTAPADLAPTNLGVTLATDGGLHLDWDAPAEEAADVTGYAISRSVGSGSLAVLVADTESTDTGYTDAAATTPGETYAYQVKAIRNGTESQGSNLAVMQLPDPAAQAPSNLTAELVDGGVSLDWDAPAEDSASVTGYRILRAAGAGEPAVLVSDTATTGTSYSDATATTPGETYTYAVKALRGADESVQSGSASVEVPDPADLAPSNLEAEIAEGGVRLTWDAPAEDAASVTGYEIARSMVPYDPDAIGHASVQDILTGSTATSWLDTGDSGPGRAKHSYLVRALRGDQASQYSDAVHIDVENAEEETETVQIPAATTEVTVGGTVTGEIEEAEEVDWYHIELQGGSGYRVNMRGTWGGEWKEVDGEAVFVSPGTLNDPKLLGVYDGVGALVPGGGQEIDGAGKNSRIELAEPAVSGAYYIAATGDHHETGTYELTVTLVQATDAADLAPSNLGAAATHRQVTLSWDPPVKNPDWVTGYEVRRTHGEATSSVLTYSDATEYTDTDVRPLQTYVYRVVALRGDEGSDPSGEAGVTVLPTPAMLAPSGLTATGVATQDGFGTAGVVLGWQAPQEDAGSVTGYRVQRAVGDGPFAVLVEDTGYTVTAYTDYTATSLGDTYRYRVIALRGEEPSEPSNEASVTVMWNLDLAPGDVFPGVRIDTEGDVTGVTLVWSAPAQDADSVTGYEVQRAVGDGGFAVLVADTGSTDTEYTDTTATTPGETYAYHIVALRGGGRSGPTDSANILIPGGGSDVPQAAPGQGGLDVITPTPDYIYIGGKTPFGVHQEIWDGTATMDSDAALTEWGYSGDLADSDLDDDQFDYGSPAVTYTIEELMYTNNVGYTELYLFLKLDPMPTKAVRDQWALRVNYSPSFGVYFWYPLVDAESANGGLRWEIDAGISFAVVPGNYQDGDEVQASLHEVAIASPATGQPAIVGRAAFGETLTVDTSEIADENGIPSNALSYVWFNSDGEVDIEVGTGPAYTTQPYDIGYKIWVRVSFRDNDGFNESLVSKPTAAVHHPNLPDLNSDALMPAGNARPTGIWSDGSVMWIADRDDAKIYAYELEDLDGDGNKEERIPGKDFDTLDAAGNDEPQGIWSNEEVMWVLDYRDRKIYAYEFDDKDGDNIKHERIPDQDFDKLLIVCDEGGVYALGLERCVEYQRGALQIDESVLRSIWSDGNKMWVLDANADVPWIRVYELDDLDGDEVKHERIRQDDIKLPVGPLPSLLGLNNAENAYSGLWSDGTTMWVGGRDNNYIYAFTISSKKRITSADIKLQGGNGHPWGLWSNKSQVWVSDYPDCLCPTEDGAKLYAYRLPPATVVEPPKHRLWMTDVGTYGATVNMEFLPRFLRNANTGKYAVPESLGHPDIADLEAKPDSLRVTWRPTAGEGEGEGGSFTTFVHKTALSVSVRLNHLQPGTEYELQVVFGDYGPSELLGEFKTEKVENFLQTPDNACAGNEDPDEDNCEPSHYDIVVDPVMRYEELSFTSDSETTFTTKS